MNTASKKTTTKRPGLAQGWRIAGLLLVAVMFGWMIRACGAVPADHAHPRGNVPVASTPDEGSLIRVGWGVSFVQFAVGGALHTVVTSALRDPLLERVAETIQKSAHQRLDSNPEHHPEAARAVHDPALAQLASVAGSARKQRLAPSGTGYARGSSRAQRSKRCGQRV